MQSYRSRVEGVPAARVMFDFETLGVPERETRGVLALYDAAVAQSDENLGHLLRALKRRGRLARTVVVITADHGEALGEGGLHFNHDSNLHEATARVPLVLRIPDADAGEVVTPTRSVDLLPTLAALAGIEAPARVDGANLAPLLEGQPLELPVFAESRPGVVGRDAYSRYPLALPGVAGKIRMIRRGDHKLILTPATDGNRLQLYDLANDPAETTDLAARRPELTRHLVWELESWFSAYREADTSALELDEADLESLRSLGYL